MKNRSGKKVLLSVLCAAIVISARTYRLPIKQPGVFCRHRFGGDFCKYRFRDLFECRYNERKGCFVGNLWPDR